MTRCATVAASVLFLAFLQVSANAGSAKMGCKEFQVISTGEFRKIHYVDLDESGGTGTYSGVTGSVKVSRAGTSNVYHFRVSCPPQKDS